MKKNQDFNQNCSSQQFIHENRHLRFSTQQSAIKRVNSLRKVETHSHMHTPEIHELPFQIYPERTKTEISRRQLVQRLLQNGKERKDSLIAEKLKQQQIQCTDTCTFKPLINAQSKRLIEKQGRSQYAFKRLYQEGLSKMKTLNDYTNTTVNQKQNCTFHPNISDKAREKTNLAPIYDRLYQIIAQKRQAIRSLQEQRQVKELRDRPQVNSKSKSIVQNKDNFKKNVLQRLFGYIKEKNNKLQDLAERRQCEFTRQCPFQPSINYNSEPGMNGNFLERQQRQQIKLKQKIKYMQQIQQSSFQPKINKLSSLLVQVERDGETLDQQIERLHGQPLLQRQIEIQKIEEQIYRQCTFQPQINMISKALQGQPNAHKCSCHPKQQNYHFKPEINPRSRILADKPRSYNPKDTVEQARLEIQYKEMKECTFKPKTIGDKFRLTKDKTTLNEVRGANTYQERIEKAKIKRKQDEQYKKRIFQLQNRYEQRDHTKVEPFKLTIRQPKLSKLKEEAEISFKKACTFKPQIINKLR